MRSFWEIKPLQNGEISLPFTDVGKPCTSRNFVTWQTCLDYFNVFCENKILGNISEFTVKKGLKNIRKIFKSIV